MPWNKTCPMTERKKFVRDWLTRKLSMADLCAAHDISRKTGYKWLERFHREGELGLVDHSRRPHGHPRATTAEVEAGIIDFRALHPFWGPRKILSRLEKIQPDIIWPAASTIGTILQRHGLVTPRRRRRRVPLFEGQRTDGLAPNDVWAADFKGWFRTQDGAKVDPFTLSDVASRYLLRCRAVKKTNATGVQGQFAAAFQEFGLPRTILTDNGPPFATCGLGGLSRLTVWLLKLGITPQRIRPGHPEENGVHERMHRTLKQETANPPRPTLMAQQDAFNSFVAEFNDERPHEALAMKTPSEIYTPSRRRLPREVPRVEYEPGMIVRKLDENGSFTFKEKPIFVSRSLARERIGLRDIGNSRVEVFFTALKLGEIDLLRIGGPKTVTPVPG